MPSAAYSPMAVASSDSVASESRGDLYAEVAENPVVRAQEQQVSTFSIDVDTASYANARRFLQSGHLPPANAIRIEEFVNYFSYHYENPQGPHPFSIHSERMESPFTKGRHLLKIGLQGKRIAAENLPKRNLVFLIDVSGSMSSRDKLPLLKQGFAMLSQTLREDDRVAIVVYAGAAGAVLLPTSGASKDTILAALDRLQSGGGTNGGQGIELAYQLAEQNFDPDAINRIILASDGDFNVGKTDKAGLVALIEEKRKTGVYLSILGFGRGNLNDATMEQLADKGNGNYSYIDSVQEAQKVLVEEGGANFVTLAKDVKIQVEFDAEVVENYRLVGYENRMMANEDFANDARDAGEMGPGHSVTAVYELLLKDGAAEAPLAEVKLRYKRPGETQSIEFSHRVGAQSESGVSADMHFAAAVTAFALLLKESKYRGDLNWTKVVAMAEAAVSDAPSKRRQEFLSLVKIAAGLAAPGQVLAR